MSKRFSYLLPQLAIALYAAWSCRFVFLDDYGPVDPYGRLATFLWFAPLLAWRGHIGTGSALLSLLGLLSLIIGDIGGMNTLRYMGMAVTIAALLPAGLVWTLWLVCSICWLPSLVVILNMMHIAHLITPVRFALASIPLIAIAVSQPRLRQQE